MSAYQKRMRAAEFPVKTLSSPKMPLPPTPIVLVLLGLFVHAVLGPRWGLILDPALLAYFLPALVFETAWDFDSRLLCPVALPVLVLAVPGVLVTTFIVALGVVLTHEASWTAALLLGAIVAATDPVAVLALFRHLRLPHELLAIIEGESVLNDGMAIVLSQAMLPMALGGGVADGVFGIGERVLVVSLGGVGIGLFAALLLWLPLRALRASWTCIATTVVLAYGSYEAATFIGVSGIFATAAAGLAAPALAGFIEEEENEVHRKVEHFWDVAASIANASVFFLVGLNIVFDGIIRSPLIPLAALLALLAARVVLAYGLVPLRKEAQPQLAWRHTIALAGLRGGLSLALALGLPLQVAERGMILNAVLAIVFMTLVVQGMLIAPFLRRLRFSS